MQKTAEDVAKEAQKIAEQVKAKRIAAEKQNQETKQPDAESSPVEKTALEQKEKAPVSVEDAERKAETDKKILESKDDELKPEELEKKKVLKELAVKEKAESEEREKKSNAEKRINELVGQVKALKDQVEKSTADKEKITTLESELRTLKEVINKPTEQKTQDDEISKQEQARIVKYLEEDKSLPKERRREITRDELEEWLIEDMVGAYEWLVKRGLRRDRERNTDIESFNAKKQAEEIIRKQDESKNRVIRRHPELNTIKSRTDELKAQGKSDAEVQQIIFKENPKAKIIAEILKEGQDKFIYSPDGPELLVEEMERRLSRETKSSHKEEVDPEKEKEREKRIAEEAAEAERQRLASIDEGVRSNGGPAKEVKTSDEYKKGLALYLRAFPKKTEADYKKSLDRRNGIVGLG